MAWRYGSRTIGCASVYLVESKAVRELGPEIARRYVQTIDLLREAATLSQLRAVPWLRCHPLKGNRAGQWAINLNRYYRLIFVLIEKKPEVLRIDEVSKHYGD